MQRLHRLILRMLPGPIVGWLGTVMFLLLMQFLIKYLPDLAGKGLPFFVIVELIAYNLAYMLVLAVPMAVLIGTMMVFGRFSESRAYVVVKASGISPIQLIWPTLVVGLLLAVGMTYFNNRVLPEANFRARNLWVDIREKRPGFELQPGVFYEGLNDYSILVQEISSGTDRIQDVLIYDYSGREENQTVIKAREGHIQSVPGETELLLTLFDGEMHRLKNNQSATISERYERLSFDRYQMRLDLSDFDFQRTAEDRDYRSDRTMRTRDMIRLVDSLQQSIDSSRANLIARSREVLSGPTVSLVAGVDSLDSSTPGRLALVNVDSVRRDNIYLTAINQSRSNRALIDDTRRSIEWEAQRADRFRVEIHKKYSIAIACLIFALIGAPLGLSVRRGGLGTVGLLSAGIFLFYWVTLVQGEKLADRGFLVPWVGMWGANIVMICLGIWLMLYVSLDLRATTPLRRRIADRLRRLK